jgi:hypothetical protein
MLLLSMLAQGAIYEDASAMTKETLSRQLTQKPRAHCFSKLNTVTLPQQEPFLPTVGAVKSEP